MGHSTRLLECLERRLFVTPSLRKVIVALPDRPDPASMQGSAVVALVVMNAWMCLGEAALDLFRELDEVTDGVHGFSPRDAQVSIDRPAAADKAGAAAESLATRLGFSAGHRTKIALVVHDCARAVSSQTTALFALRALLDEHGPRGLLFEARIEPSGREERLQLGSAPTLSPRHIERVADEFSVKEDAAGRILLHAVFRAAPKVGDVSGAARGGGDGCRP